MAFPIIPKRRSGAPGNPTTLELGELAVNTADGELYLGGDAGVMLLNGPVAAGTTTTEHTGDGTTVAFTFGGYNGTDDGGYVVSVGGIDQPPSKYSISNTAGGTLTFTDAPKNGELVSIRAIVAGGGGGSGITELTGDVTALGAGSVAATVAGIQNVPISATTPTINQSLVYDGTQWVPYAEYPQWNGATAYNIGDIVRANGKLYKAIQTSSGINPDTDITSSQHWGFLFGSFAFTSPTDPTQPAGFIRISFSDGNTGFLPVYQ